MSRVYTIAGGDMRFLSLAEQLSADNRVYLTGFSRADHIQPNVTLAEDLYSMPEQADVLILPMPVSNDGITVNAPFSDLPIPIDNLGRLVKKDGLVFGGRVSKAVTDILNKQGIALIDYSQREELLVLNALATAEGALNIALSESQSMLSGRRILILGMGRISKCLIKLLSGFGADITIAARRCSDLSWAEVYGCKTVYIKDLAHSSAVSEAEIIFNTVPSLIMDNSALEHCKKNVLIIDLASKPGGVDFDAAGRLGIRAIWALALPGKTAPKSAGQIIGKTIENIINERNT